MQQIRQVVEWVREQFWERLGQTLPQLTETLANLSLKQVLLAVGVLLVLVTFLRLSTRRRGTTAGWLCDNLQVIVSVVVVVFLLIRPFLFQAFYIPSSSMEPTLMGPPEELFGSSMSAAHSSPLQRLVRAVPPQLRLWERFRNTGGDRLLVNKLIYRVTDPQRLDIVVFKAPPAASPEQKEFIKRVIGLPRETIEVVPPRLLVDGRSLAQLVNDNDRGIDLPEKRTPRVESSGRAASMTTGYAEVSFRVLARDDVRTEYYPTRVLVDGKEELSDAQGRIQEQVGFAEYGGAPTVEGRVYSIDGSPRLAVVRGQALKYDPGHVLVNGRRLEEPYIADAPRYVMAPKKLAPDEYFMMGDNRNNSNDSHAWGPLTRERVIGRAELLFWPLHRAAVIHWWLLSVLAAAFLAYHAGQRLLTRR